MNVPGLDTVRQKFKAQFALPIEITGHGCEFKAAASFFPPFCKVVYTRQEHRNCLDIRRRALETAVQTGRENIFLCHRGLICCVYPLLRDNECAGGLFMGKVRVRSDSDTSVPMPDTVKSGLSNLKKAEKAWNRTIMVTPEEFQKAVDYFVALIKTHIKHDTTALREKYITADQQSRIAEIIHEHKVRNQQPGYPYALEKSLSAMVAEGNRIEAIKALNEVLASILFKDPGNMAVIKSRMLELVVVLSRAVAETNAEQDRLFEINRESMEKITGSDNLEQICLYVARTLEKYLDLSVSGQSKLKNRSLQLALSYIHSHLEEKLTLGAVARQAGIGPFRLAHLFREIMGTTFVDYVTNQRISLARKLLVNSDLTATEIAFRVGFSDQSYFTKIFKIIAGVTPKKFQTENKKLQKYFSGA